jgi:hypothetical protein
LTTQSFEGIWFRSLTKYLRPHLRLIKDTFVPNQSIRSPFLAVEAEEPLQLPPYCVSCGKETSHTTRIDVNAGDSATEIKDALKHVAGIISVRTMKVPCCRACSRRLNFRTLLAASLVFVGIGLFGVAAAVDSLLWELPVEVWMGVTFLGIMTALFGPILVDVKVRKKLIPVDIWQLSGGRFRYAFYSHLFSNAFHKQADPAVKSQAAAS